MDFGGGAGKQAVIRSNSFLNVSAAVFGFAALINKHNFGILFEDLVYYQEKKRAVS